MASIVSVPYSHLHGGYVTSAPKLPVFVGARGQHGGSLLSSIFRAVGRFAVPAFKSLVLPAIRGVAGDVIRGRNFKESAKRRGKDLLVGAIHKGVDTGASVIKRRATSAIRRQRGSGTKRKSSSVRTTNTKRRKTTTKSKKKQTGRGTGRAKPKTTVKRRRNNKKAKKQQTGGSARYIF